MSVTDITAPDGAADRRAGQPARGQRRPQSRPEGQAKSHAKSQDRDRDQSGEASSPPTRDEMLKARRRAAGQWLKRAASAGRIHIWMAAIAGTLKGAALIIQAWALSTIVYLAVAEKQSLTELTQWLTILGAAILARAVLVYLQEAAGAGAARRVAGRVHERMMHQILTAGPAFTRTRDTGSVATAAIDHVLALENYIARYRPQQIIALTVPLLILAATVQVNWLVAILFAVTGPLVPFFMALIGMKAATASARQFETLERMGAHFLDRLRGLTTLKLFGQAELERDGIAEVAEGFRKRTMRVLRIAFLSSTVLEFFSTIAVALVALYIGFGLMGIITFGPVASVTLQTGLFVLLLAPEFFQPLRQLGAFYHDRAAAIGAAESLMTILPPEAWQARRKKGETPSRPRLASSPEIRFENVALRYPNGRQALAKVNLTVERGETLVIAGPSGAGKSSLIDLALGFQAPTDGQVMIAGQPVTPEDREWLQASVAWASQRPHLFHGTLAENIALGLCDPTSPAVIKAAEAARVMDFAKDLPLGLDTEVGERGFGLSGGQARRVAIARAFLKDAPIVLLDEPTANLDRETEDMVIQALRQLVSGRTAILVTHSEALMALGRRVVRIQNGHLDAPSPREKEARLKETKDKEAAGAPLRSAPGMLGEDGSKPDSSNEDGSNEDGGSAA